ncbi:BRISC and BRCA1-A complex member 1 isoform X4 [Rhincodon typus]|uniref:BRISC and BRCA1-A complex member 1 isoform X4 n=1 Tax=Rhincodon typus TaxID=259920 RepID=UPI00202FC4B7|nr:BRISC and BRCA1-A complex member 1 isoform X4 [Rhincodon typus]
MAAAAEDGREAPAGSEPEPETSRPMEHRPSTRSNPEGAEDRQDPPGQGAQAGGSREGDGEAGTESPGTGGRTRSSRRRPQEQEAQGHNLPPFQPQPQPQSQTQPQPQPQAQNQSQYQGQPQTQAQSLPQSQSQTQFLSKTQTLTQSQSQPQFQNQSTTPGQPSFLPQSQSQPQFQSPLQLPTQFQSQTLSETQIRTPKVNCPEKVIICLDLSEEMSLQKLDSMNGSKTNALNIAQKMIEMFVRTKHKIDKRHEFALVVVNDEVTWLSGFTSDPREVCSCLYDLDTNVCESFNGLFKLIKFCNLLTFSLTLFTFTTALRKWMKTPAARKFVCFSITWTQRAPATSTMCHSPDRLWSCTTAWPSYSHTHCRGQSKHMQFIACLKTRKE